MDIDEFIWNELRTGGPWKVGPLVRELNERERLGVLEGFTGLLGASAVAESLGRLKAAGKAVEIDGEWLWRPERKQAQSGRSKQESLF